MSPNTAQLCQDLTLQGQMLNAIKEKRGEERGGEERAEGKRREETYLLMFLNPGPYMGFRCKQAGKSKYLAFLPL